jgi:PhzF family phenazine biosynthesis protein
MQQLAAEMNLAETAFVVPKDEPGAFQLRWFTPAVEVDLCGHATLAAAHVLFQQPEHAELATLQFSTRSGLLRCERDADFLTLDFPATPPRMLEHSGLNESLAHGLGVALCQAVARSKFDLLVPLDSADQVRRLVPDMHKLAQLETRGVIVTAPADQAGIDFISRFFAPRCGVNEDPVTGSAHCCLAPYWSSRLGRNHVTGYQASSRGGEVRCRVEGDRVLLSGRAITTLEARLVAGLPK